MLSVAIIGAGQVGQTLGYLWVKHQLVTIVGVVNRRLTTAQAAVQFMGQGVAYPSVHDLPHADLIIITTPDDEIAGVAERLADHVHSRPGDIVLHCSGALNSDCLGLLSQRGVATASIHPMMSFKQVQQSVTHYANIPCALEGDARALPTIQSLFTAIGSNVYPIHKDKKTLYHVAGVFASNYQVTLAQKAFDCLLAAGLEEAQAHRVLTGLLHSTYANIAQAKHPKSALTGPLQRGDVDTIAAHVHALTSDLQPCYQVLGLATLSLLDWDDELHQRLFKLLSLKS